MFISGLRNDNRNEVEQEKKSYVTVQEACDSKCPRGGCIGKMWLCRGVCYCYGVSLSLRQCVSPMDVECPVVSLR